MRKGAIFDVDGTLLDSMPIWENASERFLEELGIEAEPGLNEIMFRMSLDEGAAYLRSAYNLAMTDQEIKEGVLGVIRDFYFYQAQPKPGAAEFLERMKERGIPMYIATSNNREHVRAAFERLGLYDYFEGLITCEEAGAGKDAPVIFMLASERMGLTPPDIFVFEDVIHAVRTANRAGFVTVGVFDPASSADNAAMRAESGLYLHSLENWERFRNFAFDAAK
jgi:HAD superfamily hydrolase (TIGR01509 family)